jgi:hypothetical protein
MSLTLNWTSDRGFELELEAANDDISVRLGAMPVPADGKVELREGVELFRLEILFKALVDVSGAPGQLVEAHVQMVENDGALLFTSKIEDVETGEILDFKAQLPLALEAGVPDSGGPRPSEGSEDDLDWDDETTLEKMILSAPELGLSAESVDMEEEAQPADDDKGLAALLKALISVDDPAGDVHAPTDPAVDIGAALKAASLSPADPADQQFSASQSARMLLDMLIAREGLEIEEDHTVDELVQGVVSVLESHRSPQAQASTMAEWLLDQPAVADLYMGDDDLAELLEQW